MDILKNSIPCNPNASKQVKAVMEYLRDISGKGIITGQHTQTTIQKELKFIHQVSGKQPALCGFELLSYSPNINYETCDGDCILEIH
jgi:mannan endo-1,4-beta-mannosidase